VRVNRDKEVKFAFFGAHLSGHEMSRLSAIEGETGRKKAFKRYPIGYFHIDIV